jgi:hypothetical protein
MENALRLSSKKFHQGFADRTPDTIGHLCNAPSLQLSISSTLLFFLKYPVASGHPDQVHKELHLMKRALYRKYRTGLSACQPSLRS